MTSGKMGLLRKNLRTNAYYASTEERIRGGNRHVQRKERGEGEA